ncbi:FAD-dependent monooxygenase [Kitasatospora phosalacinea]|uniref:Monooxygenase n=1 Tax=Kitasatospora phosalacinea TaxID=2065 RepID=A0A9W6PE72_9ACTN|nr:FAD-dependent monooxygenase [Kitasatospora phosalacinea]GLW53451.1 monooxygenase [Kitasatospora phosalacinea]
MHTSTADICVVGGGPAGLTLALLLLKSGVSVTLLEKSRSTDRSYRGEILQPGGMAVLDELGVLDAARKRGCHPHERFQLVSRDRVLLDVDYRRLPDPYNCLLSLPQPHLLDTLLDACLAHEGFRHLPGTRATELLTRDGAVCGVRGSGPDGEQEVRAQCVVGADGRYSKVRRLAGIDAARVESFTQDVLWFKLPVAEAQPDAVQVYRSGGNPMLVYHSHPNQVQFGWTLPHGGYRALAERGVEHVRDQIALAVPQYADAVRERITRLSDLSLLDVFSGQATTWAADGLVLIGDSAHTHGPIGAQGINLAVQDAALLHPVLLDALHARDTGAARLARFERERRPDIVAALKLQALQGRAMLSSNPVADTVRPVLARAVSRTPLYHALLRRIAYGRQPVRVHTDRFTTT